jgi:ABC-type multidrug transport system ATPase subunit
MTALHTLNRITPAATDSTRGVRIVVDDLGRRLRLRHGDDVTLLDGVSFTLTPGELVAIVGPSGAGKTTLLETIAGVAPASSGSVAFDGVDVHANAKTFRGVLGYVPQDDIIHADLPLERTLRYAARLRLPSSTGAAEVNDAVSGALDAVGLTAQADVRVGSLSGGQRKRASIAVELLTDPHVFFLDEPTSGLDPITSAELVARLRRLADESATVVFTTHSVEDLAACDRIVFMMRGGRVGFVGTVGEALDRFGAESIPALYNHLARSDTPAPVARPTAAEPAQELGRPVPGVRAAGGRRAVLTRRTFATLCTTA